MRPIIILFAKAPVAGLVKTRLRAVLTGEQAAALHEAMVRDACEMLAELRAVAEVELHTDQPTGAWEEFPFPRRLQPFGELGVKLELTLRGALKRGAPRVAIVGSDSPGLPAAWVEDLLAPGEDVSLGPTRDGGFWGIAASRATEGMFRGVAFSTAQAREQTERALRDAGLTVRLGKGWFDVDEPTDLELLDEVAGWARHTARWVAAVAGGDGASSLLRRR